MRQLLLLLAWLSASLPSLAAEPAKNFSKPNLTVLVDASMLLPLAQISRSYAADGKTPLTILVKNATEAQTQIEQGLEAHIVITADNQLINRLSEQGLTDVSSRRSIARTQLALVTASGLSKEAAIAKHISFASMLHATPDLPVYAHAPDSIAGARAAQLLTGQSFSPALAARLEVKPNHDELLTALRDAPSLGLILAADAVTEPDIRILSLLSDDISPPVAFDAVVLGGESMEDARAFVSYLTTRKARTILKRFGYQPPGS